MMRLIIAVSLLLTLAACGGAEKVWASDEDVARAKYRHDGPPTITLFTVISNKTGAGAHSSLLINGSERLIFDPAGTWRHPNLPERNDVHYGMTDKAVDFYVDYHARITYHVVRQDIVVSPQVAEMAIRAVERYGAVPKGQCAISVGSILRDLPGFESISPAWFPNRVMKQFGALPGVTERKFYDDDPEENGEILTRGI
ncbi:hypothetical protein SAMN05444851_0494 [Aliiroseovarius sediminilitoris]|uniref:Lipoprotein n=1 Tax=Aliiroseovarius sediminilitoris TaxID=1173584 RepID=A0A1I0N391_9RHOB|nr:hypothetical protein [Aliiroseovarius sediminilitoris]SEV94828.1 hypothetical protein SAMN05444851_0494 [Aliiroseovarius sediminilitoris]